VFPNFLEVFEGFVTENSVMASFDGSSKHLELFSMFVLNMIPDRFEAGESVFSEWSVARILFSSLAIRQIFSLC
jgi:hypothetical protein